MSKELSPKKLALVKNILTSGSLIFEPSKLTSGVTAPYKYRPTHDVVKPGIYEALVQANAEALIEDGPQKKDFDVVAGIPNTGIPIARAISEIGKLPYLEMEKRRFGVNWNIFPRVKEPADATGLRVWFVDNNFTTGLSAVEYFTYASYRGLSVARVSAAVDRQEGGLQNLKNLGLDTNASVTISQVLDHAPQFAPEIPKEKIDEIRKYIEMKRKATLKLSEDLVFSLVQKDFAKLLPGYLGWPS